MRILEIYAKYTIAYILFFAQCCLKPEDKLKVIQYMEKGRTVNDITRELGIRKTQVYKLYKNRDSLLASVRKSGIPKHSKKVKNSAKYPDMSI